MSLGSFVRFFSLGVVAATAIACGSNNSSPTSATATPTPSPTPAAAAADVVITIKGMLGSQSYSPSPATVAVGKTVAWTNADSVAHTSTANDGSFDTGTIAPGATSKAITMTATGTFAYFCAIHPSMVGQVVVQ